MEGATIVLFQYGLAGVVIFGLVIAVVYLWRDNQRLYGKIETLQEARRLDAIETRDKVVEPVELMGRNVGLLVDKIVLGKGER
jgi:hypothetical protein